MDHESPNQAEGVDDIADRAQKAIESVREQTRTLAGNLKDLVKGTASAAGKKLERAASSVRDGLPHDGVVGAAAGSVADYLESAGERLEKQEIPEVRKTLESWLRRRPFAALLMSVGAGYLIARAIRR
jgi:ElaB/YqjD/DUF883 family membrane-anchored ribosome-binding protein